jgi:hypothetical protein
MNQGGIAVNDLDSLPAGRYAADGSWRGFVYLLRLAGEERVKE